MDPAPVIEITQGKVKSIGQVLQKCKKHTKTLLVLTGI